ncbi:MAG: aldehyde ferredoxin oxidoreductase C-terminal domain-containing protein [Candidatus Promineifilaceae bacterium]
MEIWRVNARRRSLLREATPKSWEKFGGRGLVARIMRDETPPTCDPLGPRNKLIFAPGLLVGHMLSSCDRISVGGKSPLTGGIKESNAGGRTGLHLTHLGIKALIIEDRPEDDELQIMVMSTDGISFEPAADVLGKGVYAAAEILISRYGKNTAIALIGPGGERKLSSAGIQNIDKDRSPSRIAARGGLGAVMASKGLKAIVIDKSGGEKPDIVDPAAFRSARKRYTEALMSHPQTRVYNDYGTAAMTMMASGFGALPTRNFSTGEFEGAERISGEMMRDMLLERAGDAQTSHACMAGCTIKCSNVFADDQGAGIVSPLEYETIGLLGSNLGIDSLDAIAGMNWIVNDLGLDSIEIGAALGVAAEAGVWEFGDEHRAMELLEEIRQGTPLGLVLGHGAAVTGRVLGVSKVPVVKGQAMSAYEPRAIKGTGVTYATSPQGADHTAGLTIRAKVDHLDPTIQTDISRSAQINMAGYDSLGVCSFGSFGFAVAPDAVRDLLNARYGWDSGDDILQKLGRTALTLEREFNSLAGFTSADDRIPEWMTIEPLAPHNAVFDVSDEDLDSIFDWIS